MQWHVLGAAGRELALWPTAGLSMLLGARVYVLGYVITVGRAFANFNLGRRGPVSDGNLSHCQHAAISSERLP